MHLGAAFSGNSGTLDEFDPLDTAQVFGRGVPRIIVHDDYPDAFEIRVTAQRTQTKPGKVDGLIIRYDDGDFRFLHVAVRGSCA
ncbi:hypothetical protein SDC9_140435 [bioreactor metagenome]|uniref:Uncharacterized protein n=1 Tax=bioreactor metagenome TaxID=1076179 RepID=A0A645DVH9_9ZZZZ